MVLQKYRIDWELHWRIGRAGTGGIGENERVVGVWVQFAISTNAPWILFGRQNASLFWPFLAFFGWIPAVSAFRGLIPLQKATRVKQFFSLKLCWTLVWGRQSPICSTLFSTFTFFFANANIPHRAGKIMHPKNEKWSDLCDFVQNMKPLA